LEVREKKKRDVTRKGNLAIKSLAQGFCNSMNNFKVPQKIPQDLLLISEFIDVPDEKPKNMVVKQQDDDIDSSGSDSNASEDEIEADLIAVEDEDSMVVKSVYVPSFPPFDYLLFY
jgi:hypothetical protein